MSRLLDALKEATPDEVDELVRELYRRGELTLRGPGPEPVAEALRLICEAAPSLPLANILDALRARLENTGHSNHAVRHGLPDSWSAMFIEGLREEEWRWREGFAAWDLATETAILDEVAERNRAEMNKPFVVVGNEVVSPEDYAALCRAGVIVTDDED